MSQAGLRKCIIDSDELKVARLLTRQYGTSYFYATLLFPRALRQATYVLYAFFRIPDEYVDQGLSPSESMRLLRDWNKAWKDGVTEGTPISLPEKHVLRAARRVFEEVEMPEEYAQAFLEAMKQDLVVDSYATYADLEKYMYGSAAVVGLMMTELIGYADVRALDYARMLGEAMQLTNFLRDIGEDWDVRKRIYLPREDMDRFGVFQNDIENKHITPEFTAFMKFEIARARSLYREAARGIHFLHKDGRRPVRAALILYRAILDEIEVNGYDVFTKRASTSTWRKVQLLTPLLFR
jgi:phytoene synthase